MRAILFQHPSAPVNLMVKPFDPREQAVTIPEDTCTACGEKRYLHYETTGLEWVGCEGAIKRRHLHLMQDVHDTIVWGDAHPAVSRDVKAVLQVGCGPAVTAFLSTLGPDEQLHLARKVAEVAVSAHLKGLGQ